MKRLFNKPIAKKRVVFRATIDLSSNYSDRFNPNSYAYDDINRLRRSNKYYFGNKEEKVSYDEIKDLLTDTLERELLPDVNDILDTLILGVKINSVNEGSIEIIFTVLLNAYQYIASISDFFDSINLIKDTAQKLLYKKLRKNYGDYFNVNVYNILPSTSHSYIEEMSHWNVKRGRGFPLNLHNDTNRRDGFFYYLLFSNIVLIAIVIFLVWKAVKTTYGW